MDFLVDPNIAYLLLVAATFFVLVAIMTPGTGVPEALALVCLVLAGYAIYRLGFNWWGLALLTVSLLPFVIAVRGPRRGLWLALSIIGMTAGSIFFFPAQTGIVSVNPLVAVVTTVVYAALVWFGARKVLEAALTRPVQDLSDLLGQLGEAKTAVNEAGSVQVAGELWSARSEGVIPAGSRIRVVGREGFILVVETVGSSETHSRKE